MYNDRVYNDDPMEKWNDPMYSSDPLAPWNDPIYRNDPSACWNDLSGNGNYRDLVDRYLKATLLK